MSQDFHGSVGQVAGGDIQNMDVKIHVLGKQEDKGLVPAQRKELHALRAKCEELGDDPREVWRSVHAQLGVISISEISSDQFGEARTVIQGRLSHLQEEADKRRLVGKVLRAVAEKDAQVELNNYCELRFGRTQLNNLKKSQLQSALEFVQGFEVIEAMPASHLAQAPLSTKEFLLLHKQNAAVIFCIGFLIGGILF